MADDKKDDTSPKIGLSAEEIADAAQRVLASLGKQTVPAAQEAQPQAAEAAKTDASPPVAAEAPVASEVPASPVPVQTPVQTSTRAPAQTITPPPQAAPPQQTEPIKPEQKPGTSPDEMLKTAIVLSDFGMMREAVRNGAKPDPWASEDIRTIFAADPAYADNVTRLIARVVSEMEISRIINGVPAAPPQADAQPTAPPVADELAKFSGEVTAPIPPLAAAKAAADADAAFAPPQPAAEPFDLGLHDLMDIAKAAEAAPLGPVHTQPVRTEPVAAEAAAPQSGPAEPAVPEPSQPAPDNRSTATSPAILLKTGAYSGDMTFVRQAIKEGVGNDDLQEARAIAENHGYEKIVGLIDSALASQAHTMVLGAVARPAEDDVTTKVRAAAEPAAAEPAQKSDMARRIDARFAEITRAENAIRDAVAAQDVDQLRSALDKLPSDGNPNPNSSFYMIARTWRDESRASEALGLIWKKAEGQGESLNEKRDLLLQVLASTRPDRLTIIQYLVEKLHADVNQQVDPTLTLLDSVVKTGEAAKSITTNSHAYDALIQYLKERGARTSAELHGRQADTQAAQAHAAATPQTSAVASRIKVAQTKEQFQAAVASMKNLRTPAELYGTSKDARKMLAEGSMPFVYHDTAGTERTSSISLRDVDKLITLSRKRNGTNRMLKHYMDDNSLGEQSALVQLKAIGDMWLTECQRQDQMQSLQKDAGALRAEANGMKEKAAEDKAKRGAITKEAVDEVARFSHLRTPFTVYGIRKGIWYMLISDSLEVVHNTTQGTKAESEISLFEIQKLIGRAKTQDGEKVLRYIMETHGLDAPNAVSLLREVGRAWFEDCQRYDEERKAGKAEAEMKAAVDALREKGIDVEVRAHGSGAQAEPVQAEPIPILPAIPKTAGSTDYSGAKKTIALAAALMVAFVFAVAAMIHFAPRRGAERQETAPAAVETSRDERAPVAMETPKEEGRQKPKSALDIITEIAKNENAVEAGLAQERADSPDAGPEAEVPKQRGEAVKEAVPEKREEVAKAAPREAPKEEAREEPGGEKSKEMPKVPEPQERKVAQSAPAAPAGGKPGDDELSGRAKLPSPKTFPTGRIGGGASEEQRALSRCAAGGRKICSW